MSRCVVFPRCRKLHTYFSVAMNQTKNLLFAFFLNWIVPELLLSWDYERIKKLPLFCLMISKATNGRIACQVAPYLNVIICYGKMDSAEHWPHKNALRWKEENKDNWSCLLVFIYVLRIGRNIGFDKNINFLQKENFLIRKAQWHLRRYLVSRFCLWR